MSESNSKPLPLELAREIHRQGEARLNAITTIATAADLRATALCGVFGAGAVGVGGALLAYLPQASSALTAGATTTAVLLFLAAIQAARSGAPVDFYVAGSDPKALRDYAWDGEQWRDEATVLDGIAQSTQADAIAHDRMVLLKGSNRLTVALWLGLASLPAGLAFYLVTRLF